MSRYPTPMLARKPRRIVYRVVVGADPAVDVDGGRAAVALARRELSRRPAWHRAQIDRVVRLVGVGEVLIRWRRFVRTETGVERDLTLERWRPPPA